ncbi:MAG: polysaccharide deacetylase family protein [Clostridia bacterium]|nr:polysaccharide deacetylase family protein [Clostridia bacterium]
MKKNNENRNKNRIKAGKVILILACVIAVVITTLGILIYLNDFTLAVTLKGEENIVIEYGSEYTEEGAEAYFKGSIFMKEPTECEVKISSDVDVTKVGSYSVEYTSEYTLDYYIGTKKFTVGKKRNVEVVDTVAPTIELKHIEGHYTLPGHRYEEEGYTASDNYDGDITALVSSGEKDGKVYYSVADSSGNKFETVRDIFYDDPIPPEIKLLGDGDIIIAEGGSFKEPGYEAVDNVDGVLTDKVTVSGSVNTAKEGKYTLTYSVTDGYKNTTTVTRPVTVQKKVEMPEIEEGKESEVLHTAPLNPNGKVVYLTFDDGPGKHTARLLDVLKKYDIKATFFVVNTGNLDLLTRMEAEGHTVAMHTNTHKYEVLYSSDEEYFKDLTAIEDAIKGKIKNFRKILRFPGGGSNAISKKYNEGIMTRLTKRVKELGYRYFDWNVDSNDAGGTKSAEGVFKNVTERIPANHYSVVLQHDIHGYSVDAVEKIIIWGLENGYTFRALSENSPVCEHTVNN